MSDWPMEDDFQLYMRNQKTVEDHNTIYVVKNLKTGTTYACLTRIGTKIDIVWDSQKSWFSKGAKIRIYDDKGNYKDFTKEE